MTWLTMDKNQKKNIYGIHPFIYEIEYIFFIIFAKW